MKTGRRAFTARLLQRIYNSFPFISRLNFSSKIV